LQDVRKEDVNKAEVGFNVVEAPVEVAYTVAEKMKVAEAGVGSDFVFKFCT
jgi:hypothetical protein